MEICRNITAKSTGDMEFPQTYAVEIKKSRGLNLLSEGDNSTGFGSLFKKNGMR